MILSAFSDSISQAIVRTSSGVSDPSVSILKIYLFSSKSTCIALSSLADNLWHVLHVEQFSISTTTSSSFSIANTFLGHSSTYSSRSVSLLSSIVIFG